MSKNNIVLLTFLILISSTTVASADLSDSVASAFTNGIEGFFILAADKMFEMSFSGFDNTSGTGTVGYIYNVASYTPDPMKYDVTNDFIDYSKSVFKACYPILLLGAIIAVLVNHYSTDMAQRFAQATGINIGSKSNILFTKARDGIIVAMLMYVFIYFVFEINNLLTKSVMVSILDVVSPTADNFILYFMMAVAYMVMGFFFSLRTLIIFLFCGFALIIGFCLLIEYTNEAAVNICAYFVQTVFFQFFTVLYFSACILIIKAVIPATQVDSLTLMYTIMICGGVYLGIKMMFGTGVIKWVGKTASVLV